MKALELNTVPVKLISWADSNGCSNLNGIIHNFDIAINHSYASSRPIETID